MVETIEKQVTKDFYNANIATALRECQDSGYRALFMPELAQLRIDSRKDADIWESWYSTPSIRATGRTKAGSPVVLYVHLDNYFSNQDNIIKAVKQGLVNGAGVMPQEEFQRLVGLSEQGNKSVFLVPYMTLKNSRSGVINVDDALEHPQIIPYLGSKEIAKRYLERHKEIIGKKIGVWHSDDLGNEPLARLLYLGCSYDGVLVGVSYLIDDGQFLGVCAEGAARKNLGKIKLPTLEQILRTSKPFVAEASRQDFEEEIRKLYE